MNHQKRSDSLISKILRFFTTGVLGLFCVVLTAIVLIAVLLGGNFAGNGAHYAHYDTNLMDKFDIYVTNMTSVALEGIFQVDKVYQLSDANPIAPEPNQDNFGVTEDPASLQWFINIIHPRLNEQQLLFSMDTEILYSSQVHYYLDDTIFALTWKQPINNIVYTFSEVMIEDPSQFRRFLADGQFGSEKQYLTSQMATSVNAVVASAGDFYKYRPSGLVVYEGRIERFTNIYLDSCFINDQGDLILKRARELRKESELEELIKEENIRFSLSFGPILIEDGKACVPGYYPLGQIGGNYARSALCQLGPLHYLLVTANNEGSYGSFPSLYSFADTLAGLGIEKAYTLDGGQTATIVMNDQVINRVSYGAERYISDIIYFATAIPDSK